MMAFNDDTNSLLQLSIRYWSMPLSMASLPDKSVQRLALRLCTKQWNLDYNTLLSICNIPTQAARRKFFCLSTILYHHFISFLWCACSLTHDVHAHCRFVSVSVCLLVADHKYKSEEKRSTVHLT